MQNSDWIIQLTIQWKKQTKQNYRGRTKRHKWGRSYDFEFSEVDIANAIDKLKNNSAAGPDGIPAIFLLNTKDSIKSPLQTILRKSLDEGVVSAVFKLAYVTPLHKGG